MEQYDTFLKSNPTGVSPETFQAFYRTTLNPFAEIAAGYLNKVNDLTRASPNRSELSRTVHVMLIEYLMLFGQRQQAHLEILKLNTSFPATQFPDVLRLYLLDMIQPKSKQDDTPAGEKVRLRQADELLDSYVAAHGYDIQSKRLLVNWKILTGRAAEALKVLETDPVFKNKNILDKQLLMAALFANNETSKGAEVERQLPQDLWQRQKQIRDVMPLNTNQTTVLNRVIEEGKRRYENGIEQLNRGAVKEAIKDFVGCLEYSKLQLVARDGLKNALTLLAFEDPKEARKISLELLNRKDTPPEPAAYLGAAWAALKLDQFGNDGKGWKDFLEDPNPEKGPTLTAAIDGWTAASTASDAERHMVYAAFWKSANQPDKAWGEAILAMQMCKPSESPERILDFLIQLATEVQDPLHLKDADLFLERLQGKQSESQLLYRLRGMLREAEGKTDEAITNFENLVKIAPMDPWGFPQLTDIYSRTGQKAKAEDALSRWRKADPNSPTMMLETVRQAYLFSTPEEAERKAEDYLKFALDKVDAIVGATFPADLDEQGKLKLSQAEVKKHRDDAVNQLTLEAEILVSRIFHQVKADALAEKWAMKVVSKWPEHTGGLLALVAALVGQEKWDKALAECDAVLKAADPKDGLNISIARSYKAWLLAVKFNKPEEGLKVFNESRINVFSKQELPADRLNADILDLYGDVEEAVAKTQPGVYQMLAKDFDAAVRRFPCDPRMLLHLARAYNGMGQRDDAKKQYNKALALLGIPELALVREDIKQKVKTSAEAELQTLGAQ